MIDHDQIAKRFLVVGVAVTAVRPRMPFDKGCTIGGGISNRFRKLLLFIVAVNLLRLFVSGTSGYEMSSDLLGVLEVTSLTFLCFLTPYILETRLSHFINIRPGRSFYVPLLGAALLSLLGVALSRKVHPNFWSLKKLANALSAPPVITVIRQFNLITTAQSHGRGFTMGQAALTIEYWHLGLQLLCAIGYALDRHSDDATAVDNFLEAARSTAFMGDWTRVLMHALFLNGIDEMNSLNELRGRNDDRGGDQGDAHLLTGLVLSPSRRSDSSL